MRKFKRIFGLLILALFMACQPETIEKEIDVEELPTFEDYYNLLVQEADASIIIQSFTGIGSQEGLRNNSISAYFKDRNSLPVVKVGGITLVQKENFLESSDNGQIAPLFGTKVSIEVQNPIARTSIMQTELYIPELLSIANQIERLKVGDIIEWNGDGENANGLILRFEYNPLFQPSQAIAEQYPDDIIDGFIVPDGGSVVITQEMLNLLPVGANIHITLARGNIELLPVSDDEVYKVGGVTSIAASATVMQ
ncbi:MAG: hypothetical protein L3J06_05185 [Cyclobacteriaceae bacterium]|nr:hypothetical protein [Cyclobacteriaceae bacterium]